MISVRLLKFSLNNHLVRWRIIQICSFTWQEINFSRILPFSGEFDFFFSFSTWWNLKRLCKGFEMKTSKIFTGMMETHRPYFCFFDRFTCDIKDFLGKFWHCTASP